MIPIQISIVQQSDETRTVFVREVRFFGIVVHRQDVLTDEIPARKPIGFNAEPDERVYIDEDDDRIMREK